MQEAHVHHIYRTFQRIAAIAVIGAVVITGTAQFAQAQAAPEKKVKDQGEYDIFNQTIKDASNPAQQIKDLDTWTQKYPESDYKDDRLYYYIQAYNLTNQPGKVLEIGTQLMNRDLKQVFKDPKTGPQQVLTVLYLMSVNTLKPGVTPEQQANGEKAAKMLGDYVGEYFTAANKPASTSDAEWTKTKNDVAALSKAVMVNIAQRPGAELMTKYRTDKNVENCKAAEAAYTKALQQFPDSAAIAFGLGTAQVCLYKVQPDKISAGLFEVARAVSMDPTLGGTADPKQIENYLNNTYNQYHGGDDAGLKELKEMAKANPMPPAGFKIKSASDIAKEKEEEFKKTNPQLALWMGIKGQLADTGGEQYFEGTLKNAAVPKLKGTVVEGKPSCRSKELLVALSDPTHAEVALKLDAALTGKPEAGVEIQWEGVPSAFTKDPFMLTMDTEKAKIENLKTTPCAAAPTKKAAPRKK
ncbi:MAG: hypothetical protein JWP63_161 [Candidatus Solibacter sp.]|nr:hypothetical protein [Candidatus Solibacter sp.]